MTPDEILADLRNAGATVSVDPSGLLVGPRCLLTPEHRVAIKQHRDALVDLVVAERDVDAMQRLDDRLGNDGAEPDIVPESCRSADDDSVATTVQNARSSPDAERSAWQREIVHALIWAEAGHGTHAELRHDLAALRRIVPIGICLDCGASCASDGRHWCDDCFGKYPKLVEVRL